MFTGIVAGTGTVREREATEDGLGLRIAGGAVLSDVAPGDSVSVSGACLTAEAVGDGWFECFLARETVERTYLGDLGPDDRVNLERPLRATDRLDGHFVQGHVDGVATVRALDPVGEDWRLTVEVPAELARYVVEKGSIALDGISLTVAALDGETVEIAIVPETYERTTVSRKSPGDPMHVEVDVLAKYVERLVGAGVTGADDGSGWADRTP